MSVHRFLAEIMGRNSSITPTSLIIDQMNEPRPLPQGRREFEEWSDRIIAGALIKGGEDNHEAFIESQKFVLADAILHLGPTESHKPDAYFIHSLRKLAANQVAVDMRKEIQFATKARLALEEEKKMNEATKEGVSGTAGPLVSETEGTGIQRH